MDFPTNADEVREGGGGHAASSAHDLAHDFATDSLATDGFATDAPTTSSTVHIHLHLHSSASDNSTHPIHTPATVPRLADMPPAFFQELDGMWLSSYDLGAVYPAAALTPRAADILGVHAAAVYDAAVAQGVHPLGIAPANCRGGKYTYQLPGNPTRIYAGMAKLPHQPATKYSIV